MKLNAKFIGTTAPLTPSSVETELTDPNAVQENNEKRTVTSGPIFLFMELIAVSRKYEIW
jgi:hypothetical protein